MSHRFTPRFELTADRLDMMLDDADAVKVRRGEPWSATLTDQNSGQRYYARGVPCGLSGCHCDAIVSRLQ